MTVGRICRRQVDVARPDESVQVVAQRMGSRMVGTLLVAGADGRPVGIVTDRDLTVRVLGANLDPSSTTVDQVMTHRVQTVFEDMPIEEALGLMRNQTVRRLPVVSRDGRLVGIVSMDDVLGLIAEEFGDVGRLLAREDPRSLATVDD